MSITGTHPTLPPIAVADAYPDEPLNRYRTRVARGVSRVIPRLMDRLDHAQATTVGNLLEIYDGLTESQRGDIAQHPLFCTWWIKVKAAVGSGDNAQLSTLLKHFGRFVLVPALRGGLSDATVALPLSEKGELRFPGHARHISLPVRDAAESIVRVEGDTLDITVDDRTWRVSAARLLDPQDVDADLLVSRPLIADGNVEVDASDPWFLRFFESQNARSAIPGYPPRDLSAYQPVGMDVVDAIERAISLLDSACPEFGAEFRSYIKIVAPVQSKLISTFTDTGFFGTIFMSERFAPFSDTLYTTEHLLHEASHHRLMLLMEDDPMIESTPDKLVASPWRDDARPMHQILHGTFVFARILQMLTAMMRYDSAPSLAQRYAEVRKELWQALRTLDSAETSFTPGGRRLVEQFHTVAQD
ncbi:hypothetical protein ITP53_03240 [Nonomuraea sp. K274]|uniref:HEXXH motif-containing protein n=1 Tax=Nonomuraea cypriaca TaxID=1187855 RepID=A0A931A8I4_9ACTN|nr:HEXXH motif-containing putative peptide modification protein [Nonomuraea cypriaca]MBF8184772.1 hypothetical protein [Nonomuraea cypriaca]